MSLSRIYLHNKVSGSSQIVINWSTSQNHNINQHLRQVLSALWHKYVSPISTDTSCSLPLPSTTPPPGVCWLLQPPASLARPRASASSSSPPLPFEEHAAGILLSSSPRSLSVWLESMSASILGSESLLLLYVLKNSLPPVITPLYKQPHASAALRCLEGPSLNRNKRQTWRQCAAFGV